MTNPTQVLAHYPHAEIAAAYADIPNFRYEPEPFGHTSAKQAVAAYYAARGIGIDEDRIAITASTSEAYSILFKLLCDAGDEVLVPTPSYPLFDDLAGADLVRTKPYRLHYAGGWFLDFEEIERAISSRTRALLLVNPSNPAGCYLQDADAERIIALAARRDIAIISDEVFFDFPIPETRTLPRSLAASEEALIFVLNGLSKLAGMPQMKLGWMTLHGPAAEVAEARERLELILDTYLSASTPVQLAAPRLFAIGAGIHRHIHQRVCTNFEFVQHTFRQTEASCLMTEGGWSAMIQLPAIRSEEDWVLAFLDEAGVVTQPGYFFDLPSGPFVVLSLIIDPVLFEQGVQAMRRVIQA